MKENIVIIDLPGGPIDIITYLLISALDCAIIITNSWDEINKWRKVLSQAGVICLGEARSHRLKSEEYNESLVRIYEPKRFVSGRIIGGERKLKLRDSFLQFLSAVLVFDLLPAFIKEQEERKKKFLESLEIPFS